MKKIFSAFALWALIVLPLHGDIVFEPLNADLPAYKEIPYYLKHLKETDLEDKRLEYNKRIHDAVVSANLSDKKTLKEMRRIIDLCQLSNTKFKVLPSMGEIIRGKLTVSSIRDIAYRDLLGRPAVHLDQEEIGGFLTNRTILVTGAGGSIGSELCRQIIKFKPKQLLMLDAGEEIWAYDSSVPTDGTLDRVNATGAAIAPGVTYDKIRAVRVWVLARTRQPLRGYSGPKNFIVGDKPINVNDNFKYRLLTTTVKCRNMGI